ncbi:cupin domain-containing protein [Macrococcus equipercicus]|uniref:Cupin domain-containing protein n=1 Tax=Macrococcus equipercicus TaxID=69967 RepID=A0A9Q9F3L6_9STAP|nr:cupin domain-containing protein [Macrococcus equipercicus]KAA1042364.1 cupin domain-containing protein [Macrococcus equipercicus]UTH14249.1 cupin domain-containing protein [Macrococcus equipercicus]
MTTKEEIINRLNLQPHPEGGYFHQSYASAETTGDKQLFTSIYFLIESGNISHFHRLTSDELWYYHGGDAITIHMIHPDGRYEVVKLGMNLEQGEVPQFLVPARTIFASTVEDAAWSFVGCMVAPGFTFDDFELFKAEELLPLYPKHEAVIRRYAL